MIFATKSAISRGARRLLRDAVSDASFSASYVQQFSDGTSLQAGQVVIACEGEELHRHFPKGSVITIFSGISGADVLSGVARALCARACAAAAEGGDVVPAAPRRRVPAAPRRRRSGVSLNAAVMAVAADARATAGGATSGAAAASGGGGCADAVPWMVRAAASHPLSLLARVLLRV